MGRPPRRPPRQRPDARLRLPLTPPARPGDRRKVELHGHRGARWLAPENTLHGFRTALAIGVDALELDVGLTADGVVVVTHDAALNPEITRDESGHWLADPGPPIMRRTRADLARYDVGRIRPGTAYAARFPDQVPHDGAGIPTLREVLALDPASRATIEVKTDPSRSGVTPPAEILAEAVAAAIGNDSHRVMVQAFDWRVLRHFQAHHPEVALAWLTDTRSAADPATWWNLSGPVPPTVPAAVAAAGGTTWAPVFDGLSEARIAEAGLYGLRVIPWTVNDPADMARLIAWGVDGLITDRPDVAVRQIREGLLF